MLPKLNSLGRAHGIHIQYSSRKAKEGVSQEQNGRKMAVTVGLQMSLKAKLAVQFLLGGSGDRGHVVHVL